MDMEKVKKISTKAFEKGSLRDAALFLRTCIEEAFADHNFRGVELVRMDAPNRTVEGKSWHHTFVVKRVVKNDVKLWEVTVSRISTTDPLSKTVLLTNDTLDLYTE